MTNSIAISKEEYSLLNKYLGQGNYRVVPLVFLGNEPGTANSSIPKTIEFLKSAEQYPVSTGFLVGTPYANPITSEFVRFISRLTLALENKDSRFVEELSTQGKVFINNHVCKPNTEKNITIVNLRPLPRPTQDTWDYSNIDKKDYLRKWNFMLKGHYSDPEKEERMKIFRNFFAQRTGIVIGVGEKENKKKFFENLGPGYKFRLINLDSHSIYFDPFYKIILSDYFNSRNGIKLTGLKDLYNFIESRKLV